MSTFNYGKVVSLKLPYADCPTTRDFYCIDTAAVELIRILADQTSFPRWKKYDADFWLREEPSNSVWISKTGRGWLASRGYRVRYKDIDPSRLHYAYSVPRRRDGVGRSGALLSAATPRFELARPQARLHDRPGCSRG